MDVLKASMSVQFFHALVDDMIFWNKTACSAAFPILILPV